MGDIVLDPATLNAFFQALAVLILAIIAFYNQVRTKAAVTTVPALAANTAATVANTDATTATAAAPTVVYVPVDSRIPGTNQVNGNQYWMAAGYTGPEPSNAEKLAHDNAQAAYEVAVAQANAFAGKYGADKLSAGVKAITTGTK